LLLRKAKALQLNLGELCQGRNPAPRLITRDLQFRVNVDVAAMARRVREYVGVSLDDQAAWASVEDAFKAWADEPQVVAVVDRNCLQIGLDRVAGFGILLPA
jgi:hypothetical protein